MPNKVSVCIDLQNWKILWWTIPKLLKKEWNVRDDDTQQLVNAINSSGKQDLSWVKRVEAVVSFKIALADPLNLYPRSAQCGEIKLQDISSVVFI